MHSEYSADIIMGLIYDILTGLPLTMDFTSLPSLQFTRVKIKMSLLTFAVKMMQHSSYFYTISVMWSLILTIGLGSMQLWLIHWFTLTEHGHNKIKFKASLLFGFNLHSYDVWPVQSYKLKRRGPRIDPWGTANHIQSF